MRQLAALFCAMCAAAPAGAQQSFQSDSIDLQGSPLRITFIGHATLMIEYAGTVIHVDPVSAEADYSRLPKATIVLVTHEHSDHLDAAAVRAVSTPSTTVIANRAAVSRLGSGIAMSAGERKSIGGLTVEAVAAYNTTAGRGGYHPKGRDNGYLITLGGKRIYIAGDTEETPEMRAIQDVWIAFLPMNQPYTMTPAQVAAAAKILRPAILYPYHYGATKTSELEALLEAEEGIELRIRPLS